jgi:RNA polymerase sigma-70 factor (sigma-E family)
VDEQARRDFTEFAAARSHELIRLAYVLTGDQHAAEDLLQNALTKAAAHWSGIRGAPERYVRKIMYREQVSWWRRRVRRPETVVATVPERPSEPPSAGVDDRLVLEQALRGLPPRKRAVLVLRYLEDLPEAQVADLLGCSVGTVRSQAHKAIAQLRSALTPVDPTMATTTAPTAGLTSTEAQS